MAQIISLIARHETIHTTAQDVAEGIEAGKAAVFATFENELTEEIRVVQLWVPTPTSFVCSDSKMFAIVRGGDYKENLRTALEIAFDEKMLAEKVA